MAPEMVPSHCPYCGNELGETFEEGRERLYCSNCDRVIWRNAEPVAAVIVEKGEKILLVKRGIAPGEGKWSLPAGFLEYEENPSQAAVRELEEETGLKASEEDLEFVDALNMERFPDQRLVANVYSINAGKTRGEVSHGSDAEDAKFWNLEELRESGEEIRHHFLDAIGKVQLE